MWWVQWGEAYKRPKKYAFRDIYYAKYYEGVGWMAAGKKKVKMKI